MHDTSANKNVHASNASRTTHQETQFQTTAHMLLESSSADMRSDIRLTLTLNPDPAPEETVRIQMLKHVRYEITLDEIVECVTAVSNFKNWGKNWKYGEEKSYFSGA